VKIKKGSYEKIIAYIKGKKKNINKKSLVSTNQDILLPASRPSCVATGDVKTLT
jgi:hypothetical protein